MNPAISSSFLQRCISSTCNCTFDIDQSLYVCPKCGSLLEIERSSPPLTASQLKADWLARKSSMSPSDRSGVWRFRELLPFASDTPIISLQEGNTPLYSAAQAATYCGLQQLFLKHQGANPTGSFKDTGMTTAITQARVLGKKLVICASTGNTAASLAAYAARAGMACAIMVPAGQVSHAKLAQALDYGAKVLELEGNFDTCMQAIREVSSGPAIYLVNSINPFRIEGQKTVAAELAEQMNWSAPDHLVVPGGNLGNSSALGKGFRELKALGLIATLPRISVIQAEGSAPFAQLFNQLADSSEQKTLHEMGDPHTLASAIKIGAPVSWQKALRVVQETGGQVNTVSEQEIADAKAIIGRDGVGCEPASATTVAGIRKLVERGFIQSDQEVVAVLTGHVLKDTDYVINYHQNTLSAPWLSELPGGGHISGAFANEPMRVSASPEVLKDQLSRLLD